MSLKYGTTKAAAVKAAAASAQASKPSAAAAAAADAESDDNLIAALAAVDSIGVALEDEDETIEDDEDIGQPTLRRSSATVDRIVAAVAAAKESQAAAEVTGKTGISGSTIEANSSRASIKRQLLRRSASYFDNPDTIDGPISILPLWAGFRASRTSLSNRGHAPDNINTAEALQASHTSPSNRGQPPDNLIRSDSVRASRTSLSNRGQTPDNLIKSESLRASRTSLSNRGQTPDNLITSEDQGQIQDLFAVRGEGGLSPLTLTRQNSIDPSTAGPSTVSFGSQPNRAILEALRNIDLPDYTPRSDTWPRRARLSIDRQILGMRRTSADDGLNEMLARRRRGARWLLCDSCKRACRRCCFKCLLTCTSIRGILGGIGLLGAACVIGGIVLGAVNLSGSGYVVVSVILISLGLVLIIMICVGWRCLPDGQEPCHTLCKLNDGGSRDLPEGETGPTLGGPLAQLNQQRGSSQWYGGLLYSEYQYGPPPPAYAAAAANRLRRSASIITSATVGDGDNASLAGSIPPTYRSHISTRPSIFQAIFGGGGSSSYVPPPAYDRQTSSNSMTTRSAFGGSGIINSAFADTESVLQMTRESSPQEGLQAMLDMPTVTVDGTIMISLSSTEEADKTGSGANEPPSTSHGVSVPPAANLTTISEEVIPESRLQSEISLGEGSNSESSVRDDINSPSENMRHLRRNFGEGMADDVFVVDIETDKPELQTTEFNTTSVEIHRAPESDTISEACSSSVVIEVDSQSCFGTKSDISDQADHINAQLDETVTTEVSTAANVIESDTSGKDNVVDGTLEVTSNIENNGQLVLEDTVNTIERTVAAVAKSENSGKDNLADGSLEIISKDGNNGQPVFEEISPRKSTHHVGPPVSPKSKPIAKLLSPSVGADEGNAKMVRGHSHTVPFVKSTPPPADYSIVDNTINIAGESVSSSVPDNRELTSAKNDVGTPSQSGVKRKNYEPKTPSPLVLPDHVRALIKFSEPVETGVSLKTVRTRHRSEDSGIRSPKSSVTESRIYNVDIDDGFTNIGNQTPGSSTKSLDISKKPTIGLGKPIGAGDCYRVVNEEKVLRSGSLEGLARRNIRTLSGEPSSSLKNHKRSDVIIDFSPLKTKRVQVDNGVTDDQDNGEYNVRADAGNNSYRPGSHRRSTSISNQPLNINSLSGSSYSSKHPSKPSHSTDQSIEGRASETPVPRFRKYSHDEQRARTGDFKVYIEESRPSSLHIDETSQSSVTARCRNYSNDEKRVQPVTLRKPISRQSSMNPGEGPPGWKVLPGGSQMVSSTAGKTSSVVVEELMGGPRADSKSLSHPNIQNLVQNDLDCPVKSVQEARELFVKLDKKSSSQTDVQGSKSSPRDTKYGSKPSPPSRPLSARTVGDSTIFNFESDISQSLENIPSQRSNSSTQRQTHNSRSNSNLESEFRS